VHRRTVALFVSFAALLLAAATAGAAGKAHTGFVYTLTNSPAGNAVAVFVRTDDGTLAPAGTVATGGLGTGANLGSQGSVIVDGRKLFAVNAGDNSISYFRIRHGGLELQDRIASGGSLPTSLTIHGHVLYVLNAGGSGNITGFTVRHDALAPLAGSTQPLGAGSAGPAQVSFSPSGKTLVVTEKASSTIDTYAVGAHGIAAAPIVNPAAGNTPFGFDFDKRGDVLTSDAAGSASSYAVAENGSLSVISGAVATHQGAPCWLVTSNDGRYAYTANAAGGTISGFAVGHDGSLSLLDSSGATGNLGAGSHPLDEIVSRDGKFLHVLVDGTHMVGTFRIGHDGGLTWLGAVGTLPPGDVGLATS
jgi:6-phosphogluconolactonase (cycloisomerase 2 family)